MPRTKGATNKSTAAAREAIARLVDGNAHRMSLWLDEIHREKGAQAAWDCMIDVLEYHVPKLARQEITGQNNEPLKVQVSWMATE